MYRLIFDQLSTDMRPTYRSTVGRESTDVLVKLPLNLLADVSTMTISVGYQSTIGGISVNSISQNVDRYYGTDRHIGRYSADTWLIVTVDIGWLSIGRHLERDFVNMSNTLRIFEYLCYRYSSYSTSGHINL